MDKATNDGATPLLMAASEATSVLWSLIEKRADLNKADDKGAFPLYMASHNGHLKS